MEELHDNNRVPDGGDVVEVESSTTSTRVVASKNGVEEEDTTTSSGGSDDVTAFASRWSGDEEAAVGGANPEAWCKLQHAVAAARVVKSLRAMAVCARQGVVSGDYWLMMR